MGPEPQQSIYPEEVEPPRGRFDRVSMVLAIGTLICIFGVAWLRYFRSASADSGPPPLGSTLPPLRLLDLETCEPLFLLGLKGKVVWLVFWSADSVSGKAALPRLEEAWRRLRSDRRFSLVTAAVDSGDPEQVHKVLREIHASLPAYLATPETTRRFGAENADPPLHLLIDAEGRIGALVRGAGQGTILRLSTQVRDWLDELDPLGPTRYAGRHPATFLSAPPLRAL